MSDIEEQNEIGNLKERVSALEKDYLETIARVGKKLNQLEKILNRLGLMCSVSFLLAFLLIAHVAKHI